MDQPWFYVPQGETEKHPTWRGRVTVANDMFDLGHQPELLAVFYNGRVSHGDKGQFMLNCPVPGWHDVENDNCYALRLALDCASVHVHSLGSVEVQGRIDRVHGYDYDWVVCNVEVPGGEDPRFPASGFYNLLVDDPHHGDLSKATRPKTGRYLGDDKTSEWRGKIARISLTTVPEE